MELVVSRSQPYARRQRIADKRAHVVGSAAVRFKHLVAGVVDNIERHCRSGRRAYPRKPAAELFAAALPKIVLANSLPCRSIAVVSCRPASASSQRVNPPPLVAHTRANHIGAAARTLDNPISALSRDRHRVAAHAVHRIRTGGSV